MRTTRSELFAYGVALLVAVLVLAAPAGAAGATHGSYDPTGEFYNCSGTIYTVTGGIVEFWQHEGTSASGNTNATYTFVPKGVTLTDGQTATVYLLRGAIWGGEQTNAQVDRESVEGTIHFVITAPGRGSVGRVSLTGHFSTDGTSFFRDTGTCSLPD